MSQDDPFPFFGDDDRTRVQRPSPGGGSRPSPTSGPTHAPPAPPVSPTPADLGLDKLCGENPLVAAALPLLSLVPGLRNTLHHADMAGLRQRLSGEIQIFENKISRQGMAQEQVWMATYTLCSLLDETIQNTPWGFQGAWAKQSLSIRFRKEAWGGEGFFEIVGRLSRQPAQNLHLIELCYLCLSLGFQGMYGNKPNGLNELEKQRTELYLLIQRTRGNAERGLSPRWQGLQDARNPLMRAIPWWVVAAVVGAVLILGYVGFLFDINRLSDPTRVKLAALGGEKIKLALVGQRQLPQAVPPPPVPGRAERFAKLLHEEIDKNMVEVVDDRTLRIRNSFPSGSDQVKPEFKPMLQKIAGELSAGQDTVWVTGHTDNTPIRNLRFPDNWHLSVARARQVAGILLASGVLTGKVEKVEGKADDEPLPSVPNDTPEHRALNRRVDIIIR